MGPPKARKKPKYSPEKLRQALEAAENGTPVARAAFQHQIPTTTLRNKITGKSPRKMSGHGGFHSALGEDTEKKIVDWILHSASCGFPVTKDGVLTSVEHMNKQCSRKGLKGFKNNRPSKKWFYGFLRRHPEIRQKRSEYVNRARGSVTEENIRYWFADVQNQLGEDSAILAYPDRVWNMDESGFNLAPKGELVLAAVGRHVYTESCKSDKENITTLFAVNAQGTFAPPLTLYKYERLPVAAAQSAPKHWGLGKSENGWMTAATFYEYIGNVFLEFLDKKEIQRPVIVFLDGHSSHLTLHLSKLCRDNGIVLVSLYPNATHILQPLDVAVFKPLKTRWQFLKRTWRMEHDGREVSKFDLPTILNKIIREERMVDNVKSGFRATGLYPFDHNSVDYSKVIKRIPLQEIQPQPSVAQVNHKIPQSLIRQDDIKKKCVELFETKIDPNLLELFKMAKESGNPWNEEDQNANIYNIWRDLVSDAEDQKPDTSENLLPSFLPLPDVVKWPEPEPKKKRGSKIDGMPRVITAQKWVDHYQKKDDEKKKLEQDKAERKKQREEKKLKQKVKTEVKTERKPKKK